MRASILRLFADSPASWLTRSQIAAELGLKPQERRLLPGILETLLHSGDLEFVHRRYRVPKGQGLINGEFHLARGGYGFVTPELGPFRADVFIPARDTLGAFDGDRVSAALKARSGDKGPEGRVVRILSRSPRPIVGIVQGSYLLPQGGGLPPVAISPRGLAEGQLACAWLEDGRESPAASRVEPLGALDDPLTPVRAAEARYGLSRSFPPEAEEEAGRLPADPAEDDFAGREDLRDLVTVTIDPRDAKDHDDAISVQPSALGFRLWVHIADVSHYVRPGTALDEEARRRGNSVYLPGTVYPMLPDALSSGLCSLLADRDRLAFTAEMEVDHRGVTKHARFFESVIRPHAQLAYEEAQAILDGKEAAPDPIRRLLADALALQRTLFGRRLSLGTLDLDLPEADVRFGLSGRVEEVLPAVRLDTHRVVEEAMLAANEAVARELARREAPAIYRIHETPNPEKLEALRPLLNALGLGAVSRGDLNDPFTLQRLLDASASHRAAKLVAYLVLRAMAQARYSSSLAPHYGLGFAAYTHFTSPIRRYPDLVVHRCLASSLGLGAAPCDDLEAVASECSRTERLADTAEREVVNWHQMAYLAGRLGETFDALILGFSRFGARVELVDHLIEGICPFHAMAEDYFTVSQDGLAAKGRFTGATLRVGDPIRVTLARVDRLAGEAQFVPETLGEITSRRRSKRRR